MTSAGYADLLAKIPAGADWIVADALEVEPIEPRVWALVQDPLRARDRRAQRELQAGDPRAMEELIEGLSCRALRCRLPRRRAPPPAPSISSATCGRWRGSASDGGDEPPLSHGFKVGVGTIAIAALYERVLARDFAGWTPGPPCGPGRRGRRSSGAFALRWAPVISPRPRSPRPARSTSTPATSHDDWSSSRTTGPISGSRVREHLIPAEQVRAQLSEAGCPTTPAEIGLGSNRFKTTYRRAQMIRRRYTILDLANEAGVLDDCVDELFADDGFWAARLGDPQRA